MTSSHFINFLYTLFNVIARLIEKGLYIHNSHNIYYEVAFETKMNEGYRAHVFTLLSLYRQLPIPCTPPPISLQKHIFNVSNNFKNQTTIIASASLRHIELPHDVSPIRFSPRFKRIHRRYK